MLRRHLRLVQAWSAAGLLSLLAIASATADDRPGQPPVSPAQAESIKILEAKKAGDLGVEVRGHGQSQVRMTLKNTSNRRLNVILPPGLVAASATAQGPGGAAGGAGGLQSMGLGAPGNSPGGFGSFAGGNKPDFRSIGLTPDTDPNSVVVPANQTVDILLPSVCLNFGLPSPSAKDKLTLVDVEDYSRDPRVRKALRSLATFGTSQGMAQAAMWHVCNDLPFGTMISHSDKVVNRQEVALASRFVEALDGSASDLVDPAQFAEGHVTLTVVGERGLAKDSHRIAADLEGVRILGLPARIVSADEMPRAAAPALHLSITLFESKAGETSGKVLVRSAAGFGPESSWTTLGVANFRADLDASSLKGNDLARAVDRAVASTFVSTRTLRKSIGSTTLRVDNRLPFTVASLVIKAGSSSGSPSLTFGGIGIGPARSGSVTIQAPSGIVERVELNGL